MTVRTKCPLRILSAVATVWCAHAASSPDSALEAYRRGNFRSAEAQYSQLARQKADDVRLRFNAAAAAYKNNDLTNAATWFEAAAGAPDLALQQQAYYNLGNTRFRLGEAAEDPQQRMKEWEQSLQHYGSALKLNQADTNAAANLAFVRQALEQLKQQQPPQPQSGQGGDKKQEEKDDQNGGAGQPPPSSDPKDSKDPKSQPDQNSKSSESGDPAKEQAGESGSDPSGKDDAQSEPKDSPKQSQKDGQQAQGQSQDQGGQDEGKEASGGDGQTFADPQGKPGEMTAVQAERLLDQQKGDEKALIFRPAGGGKDAASRQRRSMKQW